MSDIFLYFLLWRYKVCAIDQRRDTPLCAIDQRRDTPLCAIDQRCDILRDKEACDFDII